VTLGPSFFLARSNLPLRYVFGYLAGLACGAIVLIAEGALVGGIWWDDVFYVFGLPILGIIGAACVATSSAGACAKRKRDHFEFQKGPVRMERASTYKEIIAYCPLVQREDYLMVQDSDL
jgi:hypothetical protein